jgi:hypothetical protein
MHFNGHGGLMKIKQIFITFFCVLTIMSEAKPITFKGQYNLDRNSLQIAKMIGKVKPKMKVDDRTRIAYLLNNVAKKYNMDPRLMIAIIDTESDFSNNKVSSTGDLSFAQINPDVWNKEFARLGLEKLNTAKLKKDEVYALNKMAEILTILKTRHAKKDKNWYARYHSHTKKFKNQYKTKLQLRMTMIASIQ